MNNNCLRIIDFHVVYELSVRYSVIMAQFRTEQKRNETFILRLCDAVASRLTIFGLVMYLSGRFHLCGSYSICVYL